MDELENNAISKFEKAGFSVEKCVVDAVLDTTKKNAGIHLITVKIKGPVDELELSKIAKELAAEYEIDQSSMDERIEKIYLEELENNTISKFKSAGFSVEKCVVDAVLDTTKKNAGIHLITVKVKGPADEEMLTKIAKELATEYEVGEDKIKVSIK